MLKDIQPLTCNDRDCGRRIHVPLILINDLYSLEPPKVKKCRQKSKRHTFRLTPGKSKQFESACRKLGKTQQTVLEEAANKVIEEVGK